MFLLSYVVFKSIGNRAWFQLGHSVHCTYMKRWNELHGSRLVHFYTDNFFLLHSFIAILLFLNVFCLDNYGHLLCIIILFLYREYPEWQAGRRHLSLLLSDGIAWHDMSVGVCLSVWVVVGLSNGETLLVVNASRYLGELYECVADNGVPPAFSRRMTVTVQCM